MTDTTLCDVDTVYREHLRKRNAEIQAALVQIPPDLAPLGVTQVSCEYSGYGDSGNIECIAAYDGSNGTVKLPEEIGNRIERLFDSLIEIRHPGWEDGEGGSGSFTWTLASQRLEHTHNAAFVDHETTEHVGIDDVLREVS